MITKKSGIKFRHLNRVFGYDSIEERERELRKVSREEYSMEMWAVNELGDKDILVFCVKVKVIP